MYSDTPKPDTVTILDDDQHINIDILDASERRNKHLRFVAIVQVFWAAFLFLSGVYPLVYALTLLPLFVGVFLLRVELGISRLILQKIAKYLFHLGLVRSGLLMIFFVVYLVYLFMDHQTSFFNFFMMGLNIVAELMTTALSLRVVRLTNEIITLINRKMLKEITEGEFKYNF